jgi:hypothetical protein
VAKRESTLTSNNDTESAVVRLGLWMFSCLRRVERVCEPLHEKLGSFGF